MSNEERKRPTKPPWLIGLAIALVVFVVVLIAAELLGFGDDPVISGAVVGASGPF